MGACSLVGLPSIQFFASCHLAFKYTWYILLHIEVILHGLLAYTLHVGPNVGPVNTRFVYRKFRHRLRARRDHTTEYPATGAGSCLYTPQSNIPRSTFYVRLSWILLRPLFACLRGKITISARYKVNFHRQPKVRMGRTNVVANIVTDAFGTQLPTPCSLNLSLLFGSPPSLAHQFLPPSPSLPRRCSCCRDLSTQCNSA